MLRLPPQFESIENIPLPGSTSAVVQTVVPEITVPEDAVSALHHSLSNEKRQHLLQRRFRNVTYLDAYVTGNAVINPMTGVLFLRTNRNEASFKGLVFEAAVARWCRENPIAIGKQVFAWCTGRHYNTTPNATYYKYTVFVRGDKALTQRPETAILYNTGAPFDVQFYTINPQHNKPEVATVMGTQIEAGVQVKAITGDELKEIIKPILDGSYTHVLTMLKHENGKHSYEVCMEILRNKHRKGELTDDEFSYVVRHVSYPEALGMTQQVIDEYSTYLSYAHKGAVANFTDDVSDAISLEVSDRLVASPGGILVPAAQPIQMPSQLGF